jgi:hypothetical protein
MPENVKGFLFVLIIFAIIVGTPLFILEMVSREDKRIAELKSEITYTVHGPGEDFRIKDVWFLDSDVTATLMDGRKVKFVGQFYFVEDKKEEGSEKPE